MSATCFEGYVRSFREDGGTRNSPKNSVASRERIYAKFDPERNGTFSSRRPSSGSGSSSPEGARSREDDYPDNFDGGRTGVLRKARCVQTDNTGGEGGGGAYFYSQTNLFAQLDSTVLVREA